MAKTLAYVGLDVHKNSITMALVTAHSDEPEFVQKIANDAKKLIRLLKNLDDKYSLRVCYEAGGCGFYLYRALTEAGYECAVVAPGSIPRDSKRVKTDRVDAIKLARYLKTGILTAVNVPDANLERDRDLVRFRYYQVSLMTGLKNQIKAFLLRRKVDYKNDPNWGNAFIEQLYELSLCHEDRQMLDRYLNHYKYQKRFIDELNQDIEQLAKTDYYCEKVAILRGFRGIETLTAMTILTNIPDFRTFAHPKHLSSYVGITPSESSSGDSASRGGITKTGNSLLRKAVIGAAQHYARAKQASLVLRRKREGLSAALLAVVQKADRRLRKQYFKLLFAGKHTNTAKTAVARELLTFIWEAMMVYHQGEIKDAS